MELKKIIQSKIELVSQTQIWYKNDKTTLGESVQMPLLCIIINNLIMMSLLCIIINNNTLLCIIERIICSNKFIFVSLVWDWYFFLVYWNLHTKIKITFKIPYTYVNGLQILLF